MLEKFICPFDVQEFLCRGQLDTHLSNNHCKPISIENENLPYQAITSSGSYMSLDESPTEMNSEKSEGFSLALKNLKLPKNPLSEIGELSENRLLRITKSPCIGALVEVSST